MNQIKIFKNLTIFFTVFLLIFIILAKQSYAFCPACLIGTGIGFGLYYFLTKDIFITGIFLGAFIISLLIWIINLFTKKIKINIYLKNIIIIIIFIILIILLFNTLFFRITHDVVYLSFSTVYGGLSLLIITASTSYLQKKLTSKKTKLYAKLLIIASLIIILYLLFIILKYLFINFIV